ncbi:MAG: nucleotidyltransferase family protein [Pseudomonadales bacterium]|nr:nucleotidyltransferase family protein [Pseudomonadales bacterium]
MKAMILAAGFGKRMLPLTAATPKPLLKVNDQSLIEYPIKKLAALGVTEIVINHAHLGAKIVAALGDGSRFGVSIHYSEEVEPLETAGGIANALTLLGDQPFILINGDIWTDMDLTSLRDIQLKGLGHLVLVNNPEHNVKGDFSMHESGLLTALDSGGKPGFTYSGMAVLSPALFARYNIHEGPLAPLLRLALADQQLTAQLHKGLWFDVGTPQRLLHVDALLRSRVK